MGTKHNFQIQSRNKNIIETAIEYEIQSNPKYKLKIQLKD